jgi:hypothetical protein
MRLLGKVLLSIRRAQSMPYVFRVSVSTEQEMWFKNLTTLPGDEDDLYELSLQREAISRGGKPVGRLTSCGQLCCQSVCCCAANQCHVPCWRALMWLMYSVTVPLSRCLLCRSCACVHLCHYMPISVGLLLLPRHSIHNQSQRLSLIRLGPIHVVIPPSTRQRMLVAVAPNRETQ